VQLALQLATLVPGTHKHDDASRLSGLLSYLDVRDLLLLIRFLGAAPKVDTRKYIQIAPEQARDVFSRAASVLCSWPRGVYEFFEKCARYDTTMAALRHTLQYDLTERGRQLVEPEFRKFDSARGGVELSAKQLERDYMSLVAARSATGIGYWTIQRVLPTIIAPTGRSRRPILHVKKSDLQDYVKSFDITKWCTAGELTRRYIGELRIRRLEALVSVGLLNAKRVGGRLYYEIATALNLVDAIARRSTKDEAPASAEFLNNYTAGGKITGSTAIELILTDRLSVYHAAPNELGISRFAIDSLELRRLTADLENPPAATDCGLVEASSILSTNVSEVMELLRSGLLAHSRSDGGEILIHRDSISSYMSRGK
jgi:hypothetical protein